MAGSISWAMVGRWVLAAMLVLVWCNDRGLAQTGRPRLKSGDRVEVYWMQWRPAEVISVAPRGGWIRVRFQVHGRTLTPMLPPQRVRIPAKAKRSAPQDTGRTWHYDGQAVEGKFIAVQGDQVVLEGKEGKVIRIPLAKLSRADQQYVAGRASGSGGRKALEPPGRWPTTEESPAQTVDWSAARIAVTRADPLSGLKPAPAGVEPVERQVVRLQPNGLGGEAVFEHVERLTFRVGHVVLFRVLRSPRGPVRGWVEAVELKRGRSRGTAAAGSGLVPLDMSPNGKLVLCGAGPFLPGRPETDVAELWRLDGDEFVRQARWHAGRPGSQETRICQARFVTDELVLTVDATGNEVVLWKVSAEPVPVYALSIAPGSRPALSRGGRFLAAMTDAGLFVFEAASGRCLGKLPGDPLSAAALSFRSDGRRLAAVNPNELRVWDLQDGSLVQTVWFPRQMAGRSLRWLSDEYVLVDGRYAVDVPRRVVLWRYEYAGDQSLPAGGAYAGLYWYVVRRPVVGFGAAGFASTLCSMVLPHGEALAAVSGRSPESLLVLKPGLRVKLDVRLPLPAAERQQVVAALKQHLRDSGMRVVDRDGDVTLAASVEQGRTEETTYEVFGFRRFGTQKVNVTEQISRLEFRRNGAVIWERTARYGAPHFLHMRHDESLEAAIAKSQSTQARFFMSMPLPKYLARHGPDFLYGRSGLSESGVVPVSGGLSRSGRP